MGETNRKLGGFGTEKGGFSGRFDRPFQLAVITAGRRQKPKSYYDRFLIAMAPLAEEMMKAADRKLQANDA
jgi:hypothetical protein